MQSFITFKDNKPNVGVVRKDNWKICNNQTETRIKPNCPKVDLLFKLSTLKQCGRGGQGSTKWLSQLSEITESVIAYKAFPGNNVKNGQNGFFWRKNFLWQKQVDRNLIKQNKMISSHKGKLVKKKYIYML